MKNKSQLLNLKKREQLREGIIEIKPEQPFQPIQPGLTKIDLENIYPNYTLIKTVSTCISNADFMLLIIKDTIGSNEVPEKIENYLNEFSKFIMIKSLEISTTTLNGDFKLVRINDTIEMSVLIIIPYPQINNKITSLLLMDADPTTNQIELQIINKNDNYMYHFYNINISKYAECNISTLMEILEVVLSFSNQQLTNSSNSNHINKRKLKEICNKLNIRYNKNINKTLDLIYKKINEN